MASSFKAKVQKMGGFLSGMVMPNIGALIAWVLSQHYLFRQDISQMKR